MVGGGTVTVSSECGGGRDGGVLSGWVMGGEWGLIGWKGCGWGMGMMAV